jgi:tRNA U34 5-carboxymethylaminomethyl modifying GTPase MnmE/TrmE
MFIKSKDCLQHFEHIDRTSETLTLIVDNYVAGLVQRVRDIENHQEEIDNVIKQIKRDDVIGEIFNDEKSNEIL